MPRKGENIFKRKDGRWEARYIKGYDAQGKAKYGYCYGKSYGEAKNRAIECRTALANGQSQSRTSAKKRFGAYCEEWLDMKESTLKRASYVKYRAIVNNHIMPQFAGSPLSAMTPVAVDAFAAHLAKNALAPKTVKDILLVLNAVMKYAAAQEVGRFSAPKITYPKEARKEMRVLSLHEQARLTAYLLQDMDECKFGVLLALYTGLRIGELCALKWGAISMKERTIKITATMQRIQAAEESGNKTTIYIGLPKSDRSERTIPLSAHTFDLCRRMYQQNPDAYVLTGTGNYIEPRVLQYRFKKYATDCGLRDVHFHTLRHTFATRCIEVGFEIKSLSEILGHSSTKITLDRYAHSSIELKRANINKLAAIGM